MCSGSNSKPKQPENVNIWEPVEKHQRKHTEGDRREQLHEAQQAAETSHGQEGAARLAREASERGDARRRCGSTTAAKQAATVSDE